MCGIAGIIAENAARFTPELEAMCTTLRHRGPDAQGQEYYSNCALGHTRLSIVDLVTGDQPLSHDNGRLCVVFNGELYGYKSLRDTISAPLKTTSDTECIPALYQEHGDDFINLLPGMFAFALWDETKQRLFCGRDRFGEKPFYYAEGRNGEFIFASELKAIVASGFVDLAINREAVSAFLALRYIPESMTIYANVHPLPPGHTLVRENGRTRISQYWEQPPQMERPPSLAEACEEFKYLMQNAVSNCLVADVEVALLLSGGLDSTTVAALAKDETSLKAYTFGYESIRNEVPFARTVASAYGLPLHELSSATVDLPSILTTLTDLYAEPYADPAAPSTYLLCQEVARHVKVALTGDGGDELLGGYDYWYAQLADWVEPSDTGWTKSANIHWDNITAFKDHELQAFGLPAAKRPAIPFLMGSVADAMRIDLKGFLPSGNLRRTDRSSMAHGLELRTPFLDPKLAEFIISLPWQYKTSQGVHKILLRESFQDMWPPTIRKRHKQGFGTSVRTWLYQPDMQPLRKHYLADGNRRLRSLLPSDVIDNYLEEAAQKEWNLLILSMWLENNPQCSI